MSKRECKEDPATLNSFFNKILLLLCLFPFALTATAQTLVTGQVLGRLEDPADVSLPKAETEHPDPATRSVRVNTTDREGACAFLLVTPSTYPVTPTDARVA